MNRGGWSWGEEGDFGARGGVVGGGGEEGDLRSQGGRERF